MRKSPFLAVLCLLALFGTVPSFAKVCHPKQPVTCNATSLTHHRVLSTLAPVAKPKATALKSKAPVQQQAMCCGPWSKWLCVATNALLG